MYSLKPNITWRRTSVCLVSAMLLSLGALDAETLFVGFNTATPVQLYSTNGSYLKDFGPSDAIAAFPTASGYFFVEPEVTSTGDVTSTSISQYDAFLNKVGAFTVSGLIDDANPGANGSFWLSSYTGVIYNVSSTGAVTASWNTNYAHAGVAFDGSFVYTTEGDNGSNIQRWSTSGVLLGEIATPLMGLYGLSYDATNGNFWAGSNDYVYELDSAGDLLSTLNIPGDARTPAGVVHDSVGVGELLPVSSVPEPVSFSLFGLGLIALSAWGVARHNAKPQRSGLD